jgi:uncharacterized protein (DUF1697 family)
MPRWQLQLKQPMPRYVAFLRGVSPQNANMPELKASFEAAGFTAVKTLLSSGNLVFDSRVATEASVERQAEAAMQATLGRSFYTIVRRVDTLAQMLASDPYAAFAVPPQAKRQLHSPTADAKGAPAHHAGRRQRLDHHRPRSLHRLRTQPQGPGVHAVDRKDLR